MIASAKGFLNFQATVQTLKTACLENALSAPTDTVIEETALEEPAMWYEWECVEVVVPSASKKRSNATKVVRKMKKIVKEAPSVM